MLGSRASLVEEESAKEILKVSKRCERSTALRKQARAASHLPPDSRGVHLFSHCFHYTRHTSLGNISRNWIISSTANKQQHTKRTVAKWLITWIYSWKTCAFITFVGYMPAKILEKICPRRSGTYHSPWASPCPTVNSKIQPLTIENTSKHDLIILIPNPIRRNMCFLSQCARM